MLPEILGARIVLKKTTTKNPEKNPCPNKCGMGVLEPDGAERAPALNAYYTGGERKAKQLSKVTQVVSASLEHWN